MSRLAIAALLSVAMAASTAGSADAQSYKVLTAVPEKMSGGTTAFIDAVQGQRIVEIDSSGRVVWQCSLAAAHFNSSELRRGADLEWIARDDTFLVAIPMSGIYRVDRNCKVVWQHRTAKVSHDADLLPNGNVLYTFAWDTQADSQAIEINPAGQVVWRWQAHGKVNPAWAGEAAAREGDRAPGKGGGQGKRGGGGASRDSDFSHANAVVRLPGGDTLVSLRNFDRVARVAPDGSVRQFYGPISRVHDPSILPDGSLIAANHIPMRVIALTPGGSRRTVFANEIGITPIRTVEQLRGGNLLLSGGEDIAEIDAAGTVVWRVKIFTGLGSRIRDGVYKAVRVAK